MNQQTQDQIAKIMLLHGTPGQQDESLVYAGLKLPKNKNIFDFVLEYRLNGDKSDEPRRKFNFVFDVPEEGSRMKVLDQAGKHGEKLLSQHLGFDVGAFNVFCVYAV